MRVDLSDKEFDLCVSSSSHRILDIGDTDLCVGILLGIIGGQMGSLRLGELFERRRRFARAMMLSGSTGWDAIVEEYILLRKEQKDGEGE